jgi:pSer/pThr/pTyr-binding forkhead associated (FHA) protein
LLRDMRSQNGTLVNDVRITSETFLQPGDLVKVGPMVFQFVGQKSGRDAEPELDADIASWLSDDNSVQRSRMEDTTVIPATVAKAAADAIRPPPPSKTEFASVAEEGRDIIRRFMEVHAARNRR